MTFRCDVAVIGGSFAGAAAALQVARGRRRVTVFDHGITRNRFAATSHGFLGQDGVAPDAIRLTARAEVLAYPTAKVVEAAVTAVRRDAGGFVLASGAGEWSAARVVLAYGMRDHMPDLDGLAACWGRSAFQCPYCHGFEAADRPTTVLMTGPWSLHHAQILGDWTGDLTLLLNGHDLGGEGRADLARRGVRLVEERVARIEHEGGQARAAVLESGAAVPAEVVYLNPRFEPAAPFATMLGCATSEAPLGSYVVADAMQRTSVDGVFAAGDLTRPFYNAMTSAAEGVRAGAAAHQSLLVELPQQDESRQGRQ